MNSTNQLAVYAFLMNTAYNMWADNSDDPFMKKLARASLNSIPATIAIDTREIVGYAAKKLNVGNVKQPDTSIQSMQRTITGSTMNLEEYVKARNMPAYYSRPEDMYKNFS